MGKSHVICMDYQLGGIMRRKKLLSKLNRNTNPWNGIEADYTRHCKIANNTAGGNNGEKEDMFYVRGITEQMNFGKQT